MNRLDEILDFKRREIARLRSSAADLHERAATRTDRRKLSSALKRTDRELAVIAEIKKASPSAGLIAADFEPKTIAKNYEAAGADAISVLTDESFFQGRLADLTDVRTVVSQPVLRKDFILDEIQIVESVAAGADAILLIVAALEERALIDLSAAAERYGIEALIEVHSREELDRALKCRPRIVGINNRNLTTFEVDLMTTLRVSQLVPDDVVLVSESGFRSADDVKRIRACGVDAILVGETLMRKELTIAQLRKG